VKAASGWNNHSCGRGGAQQRVWSPSSAFRRLSNAT
jgi:hypothetical protein